MSAPERDKADLGFLARWSRRKREATQESVPSSEVAQGEEAAPPPLTDADMPPLESLTEASEYSGFLSTGVSEELRRMALRKLFHGPLCNVRDGLDDYDQDYTTLTRLEDLVPAEMRHRMAEEAKRLAERAGKPAAPAVEPAPDAARDPDNTPEETA